MEKLATAKFVASKILGGLFMPSSLFLVLLLWAEILVRYPSKVPAGRKLRRWVLFFLVIVAVLPVGEWALIPLENAYPPVTPDHVDGIILLGGDEEPRISAARNQSTVLVSAQRYLWFAALAKTYPGAKLVFTGGSGMLIPEHETSEAEVARSALGKIGVPVDSMLFEGKSRNTYENAQFTTDLVHPDPQQNWLLVTSARHMPRSMACFEHFGWHVFAAPGGYLTDGHYHLTGKPGLAEHLLELSDAVHEYYGILAYRLTGRIDRLWPT